MEECSLPADASLVDGCTGIDVRSAVEEQGDRGEVAVFRGHMQERPASKSEAASAGHAAIELGKALVHDCGISVDKLGQAIEPASEQLQHGGRVVPGGAARIEKDGHAG